jgi:hypothetical protein
VRHRVWVWVCTWDTTRCLTPARAQPRCPPRASRPHVPPARGTAQRRRCAVSRLRMPPTLHAHAWCQHMLQPVFRLPPATRAPTEESGQGPGVNPHTATWPGETVETPACSPHPAQTQSHTLSTPPGARTLEAGLHATLRTGSSVDNSCGDSSTGGRVTQRLTPHTTRRHMSEREATTATRS